MKNVAVCLSSILSILIIVSPTQAQNFGAAVAIGGSDIFIADPLNETNPGAVYVYRRSGGSGTTWTEQDQLLASDASSGDHFGRAIAVDGNTLLIGATVRNDNIGAAYIFERGSSGEWTESAILVPSDVVPGDYIARAAALSGDFAMFATWAQNESRGAVYVFRRDPASGEWSEYGKLTGSDIEANEWFGRSLALEGDVAMIGASLKDEGAGAAYVFRHDAATGTWREEAKLAGSGIAPNSRFGSSVALDGNKAFIGAVGENGFTGSLFRFAYDPASGEWTELGKVVAFDGTAGSQFGGEIAVDGDEVWIAAPGADDREGRVYRFRHHGEADSWLGVTKLAGADLERGDAFANTIAVSGDIAVAGVAGDDYGVGTAIIFERDPAAGDWREQAKVFNELDWALDPVLGREVKCAAGTAALFDCQDVDLLAFLPVQAMGGGRGVEVNDIWGWADPVTGTEYALVGRKDATAFIDLSDPYNPIYVGELPRTEGVPGSVWRDIKVYKDHAFIVSDGAFDHGMQVFDLTQLRDVRNPPVIFTETAHYDKMHSAHNIVINEETGYAYTVGNSSGGETCGGGLHMINIQEPTQPTFAGCFADPATGQQRTGYSHDAQCVTYRGPDPEYQGHEICFGSNETALSIADVTDKANPVAVSSASYPNVAYSHQGWITDDHRYFFMNDEGDELNGTVSGTRTLIWDIVDLDDPILLSEYISHNRATDHNLYIKGNLMYQSNYLSGLRVIDISDVENPVEVGFFDTVPFGEDVPNMDGSWSNYPYFESGVIVVTSDKQGIFVLKKAETELIP